MKNEGPFIDLFRDSRPVLASLDRDTLSVPIGFLNDLTQATTRAGILEVYSVWSRRIVQAERCSIALDDGAGQLRVTAMNGAHGASYDTEYPVATSVSGAVHLQREPLFLASLDGINSPGVQLLASRGYTALAIAPLATGQTCFGVLNAGFRAPLDDPPRMLGMLQAIGRCLATQLLVVDQMEGLSQMARTDALTNARNRYFLYEEAAKVWDDWISQKSPFSFLAMDVDYFKQVNDTYGHDVGDAVLCAIVQRLQARTRTSDSIVRTGGEEFGLLMKQTPFETARMMSARLVDVVRQTPVAVRDMQLEITASLGVTGIEPEDGSFDDVLRRADRALYRAKEAGRDTAFAAKGDLIEEV